MLECQLSSDPSDFKTTSLRKDQRRTWRIQLVSQRYSAGLSSQRRASERARWRNSSKPRSGVPTGAFYLPQPDITTYGPASRSQPNTEQTRPAMASLPTRATSSRAGPHQIRVVRNQQPSRRSPDGAQILQKIVEQVHLHRRQSLRTPNEQEAEQERRVNDRR